MPRSHLYKTIQDDEGFALQNCLVFVFLHGTTTSVTDMWNAETSGQAIQTLTTNAAGTVEAWFDQKKEIDLLVTDNAGAAYLGITGPADPINFPAYTVEVEVHAPPQTEGEVDINQNFTGTLSHNGNAVVDTTDARLSNQRVPTDGSVTAAKIVGGGLPESSITNLPSDLTSKANDASVVHITQTETLTGRKTFSNDVVLGQATPNTTGFPYIPAMGGATPNSTPDSFSGFVPVYYDQANHKLWIYDGHWRGVVLS